MIRGDELRERLGVLAGSRALILGVGNVLKGDDGVGPLVCEALAGKIAARVMDAGTVPENYLRPIIEASPQFLLVIDAVDFGGTPGAIGLFTPDQINDVAFSTHALSLRLFIDVLRTDIEVDVLLLGVQPVCTQLGQPVSAPVQESIQEVTAVLGAIFPVVDQVAQRASHLS
ncbi:MAG: hydrogenase 3 maturation endopeptidase HyCI [Phycisphaerales bacterium]|nr:MAG: hydrogenase 3 maturation endopeptidase HyCI [Phycisphaerales bacterium]